MTQKHKVVVFDLDDTLYKEIDFLKSAYQEIADFFRDQYGIYGLWGEMLRYYGENKDVFQEVIDFYKRPVDKDMLLKMYRNHKPHISLDDDTRVVLEELKAKGYGMGIITDGRSNSQINKIDALRLDMYFDEGHIFISEVWGYEKIDGVAYKMIEKLFPNSEYVYVGDNPKKDFVAANERGWKTVCLLDNGRNIHKQDFLMSEKYLPKYKIKNIKELIPLV
jgi:putative hydrolase of the HAD superfamily